jgi:hypothetical protein
LKLAVSGPLLEGRDVRVVAARQLAADNTREMMLRFLEAFMTSSLAPRVPERDTFPDCEDIVTIA